MTDGEVPGAFYGLTDSGWMDSVLFEQWFRNHFLVHASSVRPLLLLLDGHLSHYSPTFLKMAAEESIIVFCLPPHTTHLLQLLDNGAFASLKGQWRYECQRFYAQNPGKVLNRCNFMQVFHKAWVQGMTIANVTLCFRALGVYPVDKSAAMSQLDTSNSPSRSTGVPYVPFCTPRKGTAQPTPAQAHSTQAIMFSPGEVEGFQERLREDKESRYALWLETFYPTNPKASSTSQGVLATILQRPTPPAQRKVHTHQQGACVLTSELCIQQLEEKEAKKREKQEEERRKAKRERKRQEKAEASKVKKAAKNKSTAQSSTACSMQCIYIPSHNHTNLLYAETRQTESKHLEPSTPLRWQDKQPAPMFTSAEVRRYKRRQEEGYDLPDLRYQMWLENIGGRPATLATGHGDTVNSSCQRGECDHPKARSWIACDQCSSWYHCLCVEIRHKKAETVDFTCYACIHHS